MPTFFLLLFKINLVLLVFAAAYYLVLRKLTFYSINRVFLIFGIVFSTGYPFINLSNLTERYIKIVSIVPEFNQEVAESITPDRLDYWQTANVIFWAGVLILAFRLALQFISLYRIHQNSEPGADPNDKIRILNEELGPFSFWQTIYINPKLHDKKDLENILKHERVHVKQWHTLDIVLAEVSLVFYWFNPGVWLMKNAVRENIEFITDAKVLRYGIDKKTYQYSLLHAGTLVPAMAIVNNFNLSDLRKRIKMMNARRSSPLALSRYLFLLPALLLITLAFTITRKEGPEKIILAKPNVIGTKVPIEKLKTAAEANKKNLKVLKPRSLSPIQLKDSLKRFIIIEAIDADSNSANLGLDVLPEPYPGDRIKMITLRGRFPGGNAGQTISLTDTLGGHIKNVFIVHRDGDRNPAPELIPGRISEGREQATAVNPNHAIKYFLNGKEISKEEFTKLELLGKNPGGKKLMIRVEKE